MIHTKTSIKNDLPVDYHLPIIVLNIYLFHLNLSHPSQDKIYYLNYIDDKTEYQEH